MADFFVDTCVLMLGVLCTKVSRKLIKSRGVAIFSKEAGVLRYVNEYTASKEAYMRHTSLSKSIF